MCGIAGIMSTTGTSPSPGQLKTLSDALGHRGPDGQGVHVQGATGLVHTRLAIIDLETGDQPFVHPDGPVLVANGEIYNHVELRKALADYSFRTRSDCEPPLHLYAQAGLRFIERLRGMYGLALYDPRRECLVLARDPFGIKPLYYVETETSFAFASEPQALIKAGLVTPSLRPQSRNQLLQLQFTTGRETIYEGIQRVLPGETLIVEKGRITHRERMLALPEGAPDTLDEADALVWLDTILRDSVRVHQRADVPYGLFFSGGIDSSVLLALMAELNERPVAAFTAGFPGTAAKDERAHARMLAEVTGAQYVEVEFTEGDFWQYLPEIAGVMDDPVADYAILPTWKLARAASRDLKVVLCGEGGDEIFGGYGRYRSAMRLPLLGRRRLRSRGIFDGLHVLRQSPSGWREGIAAAEKASKRRDRTRLQVAQAIDCADWLPHDLLTKLDRCLMAHGVEGRTPFLDREVARVAFRLPDRLKVQNGLGKWALRKWLAQKLPASKPFSEKRGFTVPVMEWIARKGTTLGPLVARQPAVEAICMPGSVEALFRSPGKRAGFAAWLLLFYALWHRHHLEGRPSTGDVFETLDF
ncbi:MAG: asparagine synthase (glutamine-hydrolyzing) [Alphaproteobacteria bacterium]|nr:asparagine synthase (glutamine-hydrolyzing) [Alphaproteobacteria bacterium]